MSKYCSHCGKEITDYYYRCLDNYLQVNYFDDEDENCFCSSECFGRYLFLESVDIEEDEEV